MFVFFRFSTYSVDFHNLMKNKIKETQTRLFVW